jgi:tetratricopeptide (TPR) repeat protein
MIFKQTLSRAARASLARSLIAGLCALVAFTACEPSRGVQIAQELDEPHFRRGQQLERSNRNQEALEAFMKVIDKRGSDPGAPESHLEAGQIYLNHIKDPYSAIYHFKRYLEFRPNSAQAPQVRQLIETAQKDIARGLPGDPFGARTEKDDLLQAMDKLKKENDSLRAELARIGRTPAGPAIAAQNPPRGNPASSGRAPVTNYDAGPQPSPADLGSIAATEPVDTPPVPVPNPPPNARPAAPTRPNGNAASGRTYTVQKGEGLYAIATKVYGKGNRWHEILEANRDQLATERDLKPGMILKIP